MKGFESAQRAYDNMVPPEDPDEIECLECGEIESECECEDLEHPFSGESIGQD